MSTPELRQKPERAVAAADRSYRNFLSRPRQDAQRCWELADRCTATFALAVTAIFKDGRDAWDDDDLTAAYTRALWDCACEFRQFSSGTLDLGYPPPNPPLSQEQTQEQNRIYGILHQRLPNPPAFTRGIRHFTDTPTPWK